MAGTGYINGHEYVDLGLSVKWATCNIGASSPFDYGDYFAWGEIKTKAEYTLDNSVALKKIWWTEDITGNRNYDAARANWGGSWRLPTSTELYELVNNCYRSWVKQGNIVIYGQGYMITGPNGNSIFLPTAGWRFGKLCNYEGEGGYYWSGTPHIEGNTSFQAGAKRLYFDWDNFYVDVNHRFCGFSVRPVSD